MQPILDKESKYQDLVVFTILPKEPLQLLELLRPQALDKERILATMMLYLVMKLLSQLELPLLQSLEKLLQRPDKGRIMATMMLYLVMVPLPQSESLLRQVLELLLLQYKELALVITMGFL
jgi:hypothetical protein